MRSKTAPGIMPSIVMVLLEGGHAGRDAPALLPLFGALF